MTTPDDTTTPDDAATPETTRTTDRRTAIGDRETTDRTPPADASPRRIPGRTPITEEAGAPLVPPTRTGATDGTSDRFETLRRPSPPPTDAERDAPLVPDLRPTRRPRADGGSR